MCFEVMTKYCARYNIVSCIVFHKDKSLISIICPGNHNYLKKDPNSICTQAQHCADIAELENGELSELHKILFPTPDISFIKYLG